MLVSFLIVGIIILCLTGVGFAIAVGISAKGKGPPPSPLKPCDLTTDYGGLLQLTDSLVEDCQVIAGQTGTYYYIGKASSDDFVVGPSPTSNLSVCIRYCSSYNANTSECQGPVYNGKTAQQNFDSCMSQLSEPYVGKCTPPGPLAAMGVIPYYAYAPGNLVCFRG